MFEAFGYVILLIIASVIFALIISVIVHISMVITGSDERRADPHQYHHLFPWLFHSDVEKLFFSNGKVIRKKCNELVRYSCALSPVEIATKKEEISSLLKKSQYLMVFLEMERGDLFDYREYHLKLVRLLGATP